MTDIVERLRLLNELFLGDEPSQTAPLCNGTAQEMINLSQEAADEIERLRNNIDNQQYLIDNLIVAVKDAQTLIDNDLVGPWMAKHKLDEILK